MRTIIFLITFFSIGYTISASAQNASWDEWDENIAFKLAIASKCAYEIKEGHDETSNKRMVKECLTRDAGNISALNVYLNLQDDDVETYVSGRDPNDQINAAFLVKIDNGAIIAFRGTEATLSDWKNNFKLADLSLILYPNGRHRGFEDSLRTLRNGIANGQIWQSLSSDSGKTLYITGHSKGGALAQGATVDFEIESGFRGRIVPYTFAAARFFTARGAEESLRKSSWLKNLWRFEYQYDLVPHAPLGQITYDTLLHLETLARTTVEEALDFPQDWESRISGNNINFINVGKLAYVGDDNNVDITQRLNNGDSYKNRLVASLGKLNIWHPIDSGRFIVDQHSRCYHEFLKIKVTNSSYDNLSENCRNSSQS